MDSNKEYLLNLAKLYDAKGQYRKADKVQKIIESQNIYDVFRPQPGTFKYEGKNPFVSTALDPEMMKSTMGFELAGGKVPGGLVADIKGTDAPFVFSGLTPEKLMELKATNPKLLWQIQRDYQDKYGKFLYEMAQNSSAMEAKVRNVFTSDIEEYNRKNLIDSLLFQFSNILESYARESPQIKSNIISDFIQRVEKEPTYNKDPNLKNYLINKVKTL